MKIHTGINLDLFDNVTVFDSVITEGGPHGNVIISLEDSYSFDPDGSCMILPKEYYEEFKNLFIQFCIENEEEFNFHNGAYGESYVAIDVTDFYIILFLDPECGTSVFTKFIDEFFNKIDTTFDVEEVVDHIISKLYYEDEYLEEGFPILLKAKKMIEKAFDIDLD